MALFSWITSVDSDALLEALAEPLQQLGLVVDPSVSNATQVLACDRPNCGLPMAQRVTVLASWNCSRSREAQLEVRSSEPQLRQGTRCQQIAEQLQQVQASRISY
jgi:hypothetical protein